MTDRQSRASRNLAVLLCLATSGCYELHFAKPNVTPEQYRVDFDACSKEAGTQAQFDAVSQSAATRANGGSVGEMRGNATDAYERVYRARLISCMRDREYVESWK